MTIWDQTKIVSSSDENVFKYVFTKGDSDDTKPAVAEAVLYRYPTFEDRTVICCSTQSGCPVGCRFCGTGDYFVRSLTAEEIVSQPVKCLQDTGVDPDKIGRLQIMFMSMGEPLLNQKHLFPALRQLYAMYPKAALLISTSAPDVEMSGLEEISKEIPTIGLQFSVHESTDEKRNALIPFKNKKNLKQISESGVSWYNATGRQPFFNYCAHEDNTSQQDVDRLVELFDPTIWQSTISVICEADESVAAANERQRQLASDFSQLMMNSGYSVRVFNPAGQDDIGGGCGQLWFVQDWMKNNPEVAHRSAGSGMERLHAPTPVKLTYKTANT